MRNSATKTILFTLTAIIFGATAAFAQASQLRGSEWRLIEANGKATPRTSATLEFDNSGSRFTGNTGCNQMSGNAVINGRQIDLRAIATTRRACKMVAGSLTENAYLKALRETTRFRIDGNTLGLYDRRGKVVLRYARSAGEGPGDAARLDDRKWVLQQIKNRQTFVPIRGAFLNFDGGKMSAGGNTGCNVFGGNYALGPNGRIDITNVISTMRACEEGGKMAVEREMLEGLREANRFDIEGGMLKLYRNRELLLTFRGERK